MVYCVIACGVCLVIGYILGVIYSTHTKKELEDILNTINVKIDQFQEVVNAKIDEIQRKLSRR